MGIHADGGPRGGAGRDAPRAPLRRTPLLRPVRPEQNPWAALPSRVLQERGHLPPDEGAPGILALADNVRLRRLFAGAGFSEPKIEEIAVTWRFADTDDYWEFLTGAAGAIAMVLGQLDEDERGRVREQIVKRATSFDSPVGIALPGVSLVASAL